MIRYCMETSKLLGRIQKGIYIYQPHFTRNMRHKFNFLSRGWQVWIQFFFSKTTFHANVKEPSLNTYLRIAWGRIVAFIPFWRLVAQCQNETSLVQDLNSGHYVHFIRHYLLRNVCRPIPQLTLNSGIENIDYMIFWVLFPSKSYVT